MDLASHVDDRSPRGIAATVARLVRGGDLRPGDRLPTVRALAADLGVSPATVSGAWQALSTVGIVISRGRAGTVVLPPPASWLPPRYRDLAGGAPVRLDLSTGTPDPELLPPIGPALSRVALQRPAADTGAYVASPVVPALELLLRESWPFPPQRITVVDGALDAISRILERVAGFGSRVAVEDPGFPPLFDLLDQLGLERVPVTLDRHGMRADELDRALEGSGVVVLQPRAHNPTGVSMTSTRARELAAVVRRHDALVVEDDHSGEIASARDVSLGSLLPDRVVHVRSYSKSHGPDLRIAAVGGPASVLDGLVARRMLGPGWTSRLLQHVLVDLLTDGSAIEAVAHARRVYFARRRSLRDALAGHGITLDPGDGINLWLPVHDERTALLRLEAAGIRVAPGTPFRADGGPAAPDPSRECEPPAGEDTGGDASGRAETGSGTTGNGATSSGATSIGATGSGATGPGATGSGAATSGAATGGHVRVTVGLLGTEVEDVARALALAAAP
ncbi:aminotransferase-like domain-containing protein [Cellulomonas fengjieae]|uniref:Aminotransferase class I/II-fold pyridoxal phosphate-dependent enzyme n=1 Tax=Cellulomonas fengjieae TaxID=2819978 RepID=A0ABS3SFG2_9CELL|nr:aminotransferase class I/II-fold pyridoxal phosphate-dependent enzyme [Cellulomonas fengjieae]MBO3084488.1 aminotransferase class I/II-fold pyridoxal phosphate-dependent enzyme [Cellulomonas fengjieae]MBO3103260.1 aminotransferase class I/II-fold pyridoxal phosphate-dependent enzyme [Cellulomonas fengjieae]QVI67176.1 aminotransferase class I/II-fold pyridoxal phosphate-dependent enzyme [Cellulomonas fengjieae]